jgi:carbon-monoxide dehydrogenase iron sulfur subunit
MKRIYIEETVFPLPLLRCCECDDAPCMDACIVEALYYDESLHIVCIDENKCVGCWMCIMVCPFGAIMPDINKKVAYKCDLCKDREQLACINACPTGALIYCETEKLLNNKRRKIAKKIKL